jgi:polysaccharide biosynthesis protein PslH
VNILIVASKEPLPARDGGRLCTQQLIAGLCELGHQVTVIAPCFGKLADAKALATAAGYSYQGMVSPLRPWPWVALRALCSRQSLSITRHHHPAIEQAVAAHLQEQVCELIIVEQLQALSHIGTVNCPVLLRMHNVESALWSQSALGSPWFHPKHYLLKLEARRLQRAEIKAVNHCDALTTLTREDALHWQTHPLRERITAVAPGFTANLPAGKALPGSPALALAGSAGWQPNQAANAWFIKCVWPVIKATIPAAQLHVFAGDGSLGGEAVTYHPAPADSQSAFPQGAISVVPLHTGSGIRMRILEAWSRGLPVVASHQAAAGLWSDEAVLLADSAEEWLAAIQKIHSQAINYAHFVTSGQQALTADHQPRLQAQRLLAAVLAKPQI